MWLSTVGSSLSSKLKGLGSILSTIKKTYQDTEELQKTNPEVSSIKGDEIHEQHGKNKIKSTVKENPTRNV